jgi:hypothetical protein
LCVFSGDGHDHSGAVSLRGAPDGMDGEYADEIGNYQFHV